MSDLFHNKYRAPSARLNGWDYASEATYFITICTANREPFFGEIKTGRMCLSPLGAHAYNQWLETPLKRPDMNLQLGESVVMPNHFHAILAIGQNHFNAHTSCPRRDAMLASLENTSPEIKFLDRTASEDISLTTSGEDASIASLREASYKNAFSPQVKNLASVIRGFKSAVSSYAKKENIVFAWQPRFHDHIVRTHQEHDRISCYILANIGAWENDCFFPKP